MKARGRRDFSLFFHCARVLGLIVLSAVAQVAWAANCTSLSAGTWNSVGRWSCGHIPVAADTVVIAHSISLDANRTVAGLTVNAGQTLSGNNKNLTVSGPVVINGIYNTGGGDLTTTAGGALTVNNGAMFNFNNGNAVINGNVAIDGTLTSGGDNLQMTGASTTLSGVGNIVDTTIEIDATGVTVPFGANLIFDANSEIDVGANNPGSLTVNGTLDGTAQGTGDRIIRVSTDGTLTVSSTGIVNAPSSRLEVRDGASASNNGAITIGEVRGRTGSPVPVFTQGMNSTLNVSISICVASSPCTFTASAAGNTVNYNGAAQTVYLPSGSTYSNLTLSGNSAKTLPTGMTVTGNFTMTGTATTTAPAALAVGGNFSIGAGNTFTPGTGTVTLNGATAQTIGGGAAALSLFNLTVNNPAGLTLARNVVVTGTLSGTVTLSSTCPTDYTLTSTTPAQVLHTCAAAVNSIVLAGASPTSAATVSWTVTFNQSVSGVDASAFSLVPTGVSGAFITAVTGGASIWTVTANTGIGSGSLGLNQTGPGSVVPSMTGTFTGQIYTITATPALVEYRMDQTSWNGTAGEVVDNGSGGFNGTAAGLTTRPTTSNASPAIAGSPGTCRYGVFNRSNKDYVALPGGVPNLTAAAGEFTIAAWINVANNTLPGQRIFIDDQNNTSPGGWGFSVGETTAFGAGGLRFYYRQGATYILDTSPIPSNQWLFVALSVRLAAGANASTATIYAYNRSGTLVTSNTGTFTWSAGSDPGPYSIGGETNAAGESSNAFGFGGNLDEVRVYQKVLSQAAVVAIAAQTHPCPVNVPDHLVIQSSGSGLTCAASTLTVAACQDAACTIPFTLGVSGTLSATGTPTVNWDGTTGGATGAGFVIPNGSSSVTKNVQVATAGSVGFGVSSATPAPINATTCNFGSPSCTFIANTAGFIFSDTSNPGNTYTIPSQISGVATPAVYLRAVQASATNPAVCTPAIIGPTAVSMGYVCNNPASCQAGNLATITNTTTSAATAIAPGGTSVSLNFDANGSAPITARYDDVGQITLSASRAVTPFTGATAITLNGSSNSFVVKPHHFDLSDIKQTAAPNLANPAAADATGSKFVKAGEQFSVAVTARNFLNAATPNFGKETSAESVKLTSALVAPAGGNNPAIGGSFGAFAAGVATGTNFAWNEVGIITLTPSVGDANYLGAGDTAGVTSGNVGRFYPDHFALTPGTVTPGCGGLFTYFGQDGVTTAFTLAAQNASNGTTQNYTGDFSKLSLTSWSSFGFTSNAPPGSTLSASVATVPSGTWGAGITSNLQATHLIGRPTALPSAPGTSSVTISAAPLDTDGVTMTAAAVAPATPLYFGRLWLGNAYGSDKLNLVMPFETQYWNGSVFVKNTSDSCTAIASANVALGNKQGGLTAYAGPVAGGTASSGAGSLTLTKPSSAAAGSVDLVVNLGSSGSPGNCTGLTGGTPAALSYLSGKWCGSSYDRDPTARATFGIYGGKRGPIYIRESY